MRYIVLKEFAKFRLAFFAFLIAICFCTAWIFFEIKGGLNKFGNAGYAIQILFNKNFTYNFLDILNILFAAVLGVSSMFFERTGARIRVQFHFPHSYLKNALTITVIPLCFLLVVFAAQIGALFSIFLSFFQPEVACALISTIIYSCSFSVGVFWLAQSATVEPSVRRVWASVVAGLASGYIYFKFNSDVDKSAQYYLNENLWIYTSVFWIFCAFCLVLSLNNYKKGYIK